MITHQELFVSPGTPVRQVLATIDRSRRLGVALVVERDHRLINTLTDGDVRRGILAGVALEAPAARLLEIKENTPHPRPIVALPATTREERVALMDSYGVRQLPIVDEQGRVVGLEGLHQASPEEKIPLQAVIMAGGFGKRLHPLTVGTPKPMLPVGGRPLLEILIERLAAFGIMQMHVTTHYMPEKIMAHFGDGSALGVQINYFYEEEPLGTAGALGMIERPEMDVLVVNGDILTDVDYRAIFDYHREHRASCTVAVREYDHVVPYGVVELQGSDVRCIREKPRQSWFINAGIYLLSPRAFRSVQRKERLDMPELIDRLLVANEPVVGFPLTEAWIDIGRHADYELANQRVAGGVLANAPAAENDIVSLRQ